MKGEFKNLPSGWRVVRLGDVFDFLKTYTNSRESLNDYDEISYIHYGEIHKKYKFYLDFRVASLPKIHQSKLGDKPEFIKNGDLVIADASEDYIDIAKSVEIKNLEHKAVAGLHTFLLRDKGDYFADGYKGYILYEPWVAKELKKKATGISVLGISKSNLLNLKIKLPPLDEQEKIAEILSTWDEAINLTINLIESKKQFKKALMQNLLTAKIRFPQFKDEWEETKLGNIGVFKTSSVDKIIQKDECIVNLVNYMDVYRNTHINSNLKLSQTSASNREIENLSLAKGDVLFTPSSETPDDIGHSAVILSDMPNTLFSYHLVRFRLNIKNDIVFLGYVFNQDKILKQFARLSQGITRYTLSISDFQNVFINFPNLKEQQKIAEVLTACDDEINLLNLKLENLKKQKQGLMQKLLSGKVRARYV